MKSLIQAELEAHVHTVQAVIETLGPDIEAACGLAIQTLRDGRKLMLFGNGGSAADAQHLAAELTGRYKRDRQGLPAIALSTDTSALTAIANDFGYDTVFARQVEALAQSGDLLVGISSSGRSPNVNEALRKGRAMGCPTLGLSGKGGGPMASLCDVCVNIPSDDTARVQEMHILIGHTICLAVEETLFGSR